LEAPRLAPPIEKDSGRKRPRNDQAAGLGERQRPQQGGIECCEDLHTQDALHWRRMLEEPDPKVLHL
jgi:hypothetical protein